MESVNVGKTEMRMDRQEDSGSKCNGWLEFFDRYVYENNISCFSQFEVSLNHHMNQYKISIYLYLQDLVFGNLYDIYDINILLLALSIEKIVDLIHISFKFSQIHRNKKKIEMEKSKKKINKRNAVLCTRVHVRSIEHDPIKSYVVPTVPDKN